MATSIHEGNITTYLQTLTPKQLQQELQRVLGQYQGKQIDYLHEQTRRDWDRHIELVEDEIAWREKQASILAQKGQTR